MMCARSKLEISTPGFVAEHAAIVGGVSIDQHHRRRRRTTALVRSARDLVGDDHLGAGLVDHVAESISRQRRVEWDVRGAGLQDREDRDDQVHGAFQKDAHRVSRRDAESEEVMGQAVGPGVQLRVGDRRRIRAQCDTVRRRCGLALEQRVCADPGLDVHPRT